jgi:predicted TIM-barrel fold metal-dependent hydrolase
MDLNSLVMISVDDHIIEPPNMFDRHLASKWKEDAPRVQRMPDGSDVWSFAGAQTPNVANGAVVGRIPEEWGMDPTSYDEVRPACYDVRARVDDMNAGGVLASLCFPQFPGFGGRAFSVKGVDPSLAKAVIEAYNDWHVDEWCAAAPGRFIANCIVPLWDPELAASEVRRVVRKGCHSITFPNDPEPLGFPSLYDTGWDPLWAACAESGTAVSMHATSSGITWTIPSGAPIDAFISSGAISSLSTLNDLAWSKMLLRFPDLRVAISEGGLSWAPHLLDRIRDVFEHHSQHWTGTDGEWGDKRPWEVVAIQVYYCFVRDVTGLKYRNDLGIDHISWEMDYPHSDNRWPKAPEVFLADAADVGLTDEEIDRISHQNAMNLYTFDPFQHIEKANANVTALRCLATHVDTTPRALGTRTIERAHLSDNAGSEMAHRMTQVAGGVFKSA